MIARMNRLISVLANYFAVSRKIAAFHRHRQPAVLTRMFLSRLLYNHGPTFFNLYNFDINKFSDWKNFLTKNEMLDMQNALNGKAGDEIATDKLRFFEKCVRLGIPTPPILGIIAIKDEKPQANVQILGSPDSLEKFLLHHSEQRLIIKEKSGSYGENLLSVWIHSGSIRNHDGTPLSAYSIWEHCARCNISFLIQDHLQVHPLLQCIMPGLALGSFRLITFLNASGNPEIADALIKIPVIGNITDNFHQGDSGNLLGAMDFHNGTIRQVWGMRGGVPVPVDRHPNTGVVFFNKTIPLWQEMVQTVRKTAVAFNELRTAGWDVVLSSEGIYILEANSRYDIDGHQMVVMQGMRSKISEFCESTRK